MRNQVTNEVFNFDGLWTTHLVWNVMRACANDLNVDINDNDIRSRLYDVCSGLEQHDADHGFGSSDMNCYKQYAREEFGIEEEAS